MFKYPIIKRKRGFPMLYSIFQKLFYKIRQEAVLSIAVLLALLSACFVLPDASYFGYIDFRTLAILFSLMTVMAGLQRQGVFTRFAYSLLSRTNSITSLVFVLVGLCFFCSMLITNDVALLTFVPFSFAVLGQLPEASGKKLLTPVVCLQTIAANLGSMLTPIGNPQNLYLYGKSQLSFSAFLQLMLPYTLLSAILLSVCIFYLGHPHRQQTVSSSIQNPTTNAAQKKPALIRLYIVLFFFCLLAVLHVLPYPAVFVLVLLGALIADKKCWHRSIIPCSPRFSHFLFSSEISAEFPPLPPGFLQRSPVGKSSSASSPPRS